MRPSAVALAPVGVAALAAFLCYRGTFYQTGAQYYDVCWQKAHAGNKEPNSPEQAAAWATCNNTAEQTIYGAGFVFAGSDEHSLIPALKAVHSACPTAFVDPAYAVELIQDSGGPRLLDHFVPASVIIQRVFRDKWPTCTSVAAANGFPRLVKRDGEWVWGKPCVPCQAEEQAEQDAKAQEAAKDADFKNALRKYCSDEEISRDEFLDLNEVAEDTPEKAAQEAHCANAPVDISDLPPPKKTKGRQPRPYECGNLTDEDCADILKREGKNPFDAFGPSPTQNR